jgi:hypothetical protein
MNVPDRPTPSGLVAHAMPVLLRQHGVDLALIGLLKLLALPWLLKVLWAPWIDRVSSDRLGHHRGWILPLQRRMHSLLKANAMQLGYTILYVPVFEIALCTALA